MKHTVTKIGLDSFVKILMALNLLYGLVQYLVVILGKQTSVLNVFGVGTISFSDYMSVSSPLDMLVLFFVILFAVIVFSFVGGFILGFIVNVLLKWTGGLQFETKDR